MHVLSRIIIAFAALGLSSVPPMTAKADPHVSARAGPPAIPVYPPYRYRSGHYPTADAYFDLPPYADINPAYYRSRYFLTFRERNRYRYVPHIFRGYRDGNMK